MLKKCQVKNDRIYYRPGIDPDVMSSDILYGIDQLSYKILYKHDVKVEFKDENVEVTIQSAQGKVLSKGLFQIVEGESKNFEIPNASRSMDSAILPWVDIIPHFMKTHFHSRVAEMGRFIGSETSKFHELYGSLETIALLNENHLRDSLSRDYKREWGNFSHLGNAVELQNTIREKLEATGLAQKIATFLTVDRTLNVDGSSVSR
jgi:hypothetical protein